MKVSNLHKIVKELRRPLLFSLVLLATGCNNVLPLYTLSPIFPLGTFNAKLNGDNWEQTYEHAYYFVHCNSRISAQCKERIISLTCNLYDNDRKLRQSLYFDYLPGKTGLFKIIPRDHDQIECDNDLVSCQLYTGNYDLNNEVYNSIIREGNYIRIEDFNPETREIKGSFEVTMALERRGGERTLPDTLHFTEGHFHTKILDKQ
jgi:hypothetical protein